MTVSNWCDVAIKSAKMIQKYFTYFQDRQKNADAYVQGTGKISSTTLGTCIYTGEAAEKGTLN